MARLPVPERHAPVVAAAEEDVVLVDGKRVDDGVVAFEVLHECAFGAFPLLYLTPGGGREGEFCGMPCQRADALFVVGEDAHGFACGEVP